MDHLWSEGFIGKFETFVATACMHPPFVPFSHALLVKPGIFPVQGTKISTHVLDDWDLR